MLEKQKMAFIDEFGLTATQQKILSTPLSLMINEIDVKCSDREVHL
jgi:hypothetical protein